MADYQVTCIRRDRNDLDRRIDRLGGPQFNDTIDNVIRFIESGAHRFWTTANGQTVFIVVDLHPTSRRKYLRTTADGYPPNNLLSLPECP